VLPMLSINISHTANIYWSIAYFSTIESVGRLQIA
jgi:hypothetical protein